MAAPRTRAAIAFTLGALMLVALVWIAGVDKMLDALRHASPVHFGLALLAYAFFFLARGIRWRLLLRDTAPDLRTTTTTQLTAVGWLANSILPLKGGDVLRAALLSRRGRLGLVTSAASVALERVLDLLGLAALAAVALLLIPRAVALPGWLMPALEVAAVMPVVAIGALLALARVQKKAVAVAERVLLPLGKPGAKLAGFFDTVVSGTAALMGRPKLLALVLPMTLVVVVLQAAVFMFLVQAFLPGVSAPLAFAGASLFLLSFVISITPGNVGTYEAAFVAVYSALGVAPELAIPAAVLTHVSTTLIVAVLGGIGMLSLGADRPLPATLRPTRPVQGGSP